VEEPKQGEVAQDPAALDQLEQEIDQLSVRAAAVNNSLDRLQQEQARQGLGLRGDMAARQESMKLNLSRAREALEKGDPARARKYRDLTESDVEALEKFLGR
jgi:ABC-type phosphate transport system auxiliary subunit